MFNNWIHFPIFPFFSLSSSALSHFQPLKPTVCFPLHIYPCVSWGSPTPLQKDLPCSVGGNTDSADLYGARLDTDKLTYPLFPFPSVKMRILFTHTWGWEAHINYSPAEMETKIHLLFAVTKSIGFQVTLTGSIFSQWSARTYNLSLCVPQFPHL